MEKSKGMGIRLGDYESDCFTNLRLADDVLLFSISQVQVHKMMCSADTTTPNNQSSNRRKEMEINNIKAEILSACESAKFLGRTITFQQ